MRKRLLLFGLVLLLVLGVVMAVSAGGWRRWPGVFPRDVSFRPGRVVENLGLTEDQLAKLKAIEKEAYEKSKELRNRLQDLLFTIRELSLSKNPDEAAIKAKTDEAKKIREELRKIQEERWEKIKSLLTKEQLEKLVPWGRKKGSFRCMPGRRGPWRWG